MLKYALKLNTEKSVNVYGRNLRISRKNSLMLSQAISGMNFNKGVSLMQNLISGKHSLDGKYYTNAANAFLGLLTLAGHNAEFKGLDTDRMVIFASAHKGFSYYTPKRFKNRRKMKKICNVQIVLLHR